MSRDVYEVPNVFHAIDSMMNVISCDAPTILRIMNMFPTTLKSCGRC